MLGFSLETESAKSLQDRMTAGTLTAETLVKAYLDAHRATPTPRARPRRPSARSTSKAIDEAIALDKERKKKGARGPLMGIPVLLDDSIDADGLPTTGGSIALQNSTPKDDSTIVAKLKAAGAIILGKTNVSELERPLRREHARGLLVARRPGDAAVRHRQDPGRLVGRLGGGDRLRPRGADGRHGDLDRHARS